VLHRDIAVKRDGSSVLVKVRPISQKNGLQKIILRRSLPTFLRLAYQEKQGVDCFCSIDLELDRKRSIAYNPLFHNRK